MAQTIVVKLTRAFIHGSLGFIKQQGESEVELQISGNYRYSVIDNFELYNPDFERYILEKSMVEFPQVPRPATTLVTTSSPGDAQFPTNTATSLPESLALLSPAQLSPSLLPTPPPPPLSPNRQARSCIPNEFFWRFACSKANSIPRLHFGDLDAQNEYRGTGGDVAALVIKRPICEVEHGKHRRRHSSGVF